MATTDQELKAPPPEEVRPTPGVDPLADAPAVAPQRRHLFTRPSQATVMVLIALVPSVLIVALLLITPLISIRESVVSWTLTFDHYTDLYADSQAVEALWNTLIFSGWTLLFAVVLGVPLAWLVERTDIGAKRLIWVLMTVGILIPGFFIAIGWLYLLHPRIGVFNHWAMSWFSLETAPFNVGTLPVMGFIQGIGLSSLIFFFTATSLRSMDASLEEAAQMSGASFGQTMRRITLPLAWPGVLAASIYVFTIAVSAFDIPLIIGLTNRIHVFATYIFQKTASPTEGLPQYGIPAAFSTFMVVMALGLTWVYTRVLSRARNYEVVTGKNYHPRLVKLGRWKYLAWAFIGGKICLSLLFPLLLLVWASLQPFVGPITSEALGTVTLDNYRDIPWDQVRSGAKNTAILMIFAPLLALVISLIFSWVVLRSRKRYRMAFEYVAFMPHAVPQVIFGLSALLIAIYWISDLYRTPLLLVIVMAVATVSFGTRITHSALIQINTELEEAAQVAGAGGFKVMRKIIIPLIKPALVYGWLWMALLAFRQLTLPAMLRSPENEPLAYVVWSIWQGGDQGVSAAISVIMILVLVPLAFLYLRISRLNPEGGGGRS